MTKPRVDILLASYNGAAYLNEQMLSLVKQDYSHFHIFIRDDGSTDNTPALLQEWSRMYPSLITLVQDQQKNLGPTGNFNALMLVSEAEYICFSDQDDQWLPDKVSKMIAALKQLENGQKDMPAMVFHDLSYCDSELNIIHPSLNQHDKLNPELIQANRLLMQNVPYGCTMMINRALLKMATPIPKGALLHDHWLALSAALLGRITYLDEALILHRVHDANASRAGSEHKKEANDDLESKLSNRNFHNYLLKQVRQAEALLNKYEAHLQAPQITMLNDFIRLRNTSGMARKRILFRHRFFKNTFANTLKLILRA